MKNKKKNHYFIGYMIKFDQQLIDELDKLKRYITSLTTVEYLLPLFLTHI